MTDQYSRTEMIIGTEAVDKIKAASVIVFGIGGVGSYVVEGLARAGVGRLVLVDNDVVDITNINRQLPALHSTVGNPKAETMADRVKDINPDCDVEAIECFFMPDTADNFDFTGFDYVVDAIDTVTGKLALIEKAYKAGIPVISSMGTGNKLDPAGFKIAPIEKTKVCPLAKVMRRELKNRGIKGIKVLYSEEEPIRTAIEEGADSRNSRTPGSISFVPSVAGLIIAGEVIRDVISVR